MQAVIVDIRKKQAAAMDESGRIVRIRNVGYEIGQTIELHRLPSRSAPSLLRRLGTGAAAAVLVAVIGTGTAYAMPYGTVTLDGESSLAYTINCFDYVLDVKGANAEGEALLSELDLSQLRHHRLDTAVAATVGSLSQPEEAITIRADTGSERHSRRLVEELEPLVERAEPGPWEQAPEAGLDGASPAEQPLLPDREQGPAPEAVSPREDRPEDMHAAEQAPAAGEDGREVPADAAPGEAGPQAPPEATALFPEQESFPGVDRPEPGAGEQAPSAPFGSTGSWEKCGIPSSESGDFS